MKISNPNNLLYCSHFTVTVEKQKNKQAVVGGDYPEPILNGPGPGHHHYPYASGYL